TDEAMQQLETLRQRNPANPLPSYYLGLIAADDQKFDKAADYFRQAIQANPDFLPAQLDLAGALPRADQPGPALEALEKIRSRFRPTFRLEYLSALACSRLQRLDDSARHFAEAEELGNAEKPSPLDHRFYFQVGLLAHRRGQRGMPV